MKIALFAAAYRIHVHQSTVKVLRDLNLGYKLELRGKTEVKVRPFTRQMMFLHVDEEQPLTATIFDFLFLRGKQSRRRTGSSGGTDSPNLCPFLQKSSPGRNNCPFSSFIPPPHLFCASLIPALVVFVCSRLPSTPQNNSSFSAFMHFCCFFVSLC